jgi:two-component system phosphate regulon sensor histidine kinase PhoR
MRFHRPSILAFTLSSILALFVFFIGLLFRIILDIAIPAFVLASLALLVFLLALIIIRVGIEQFVYNKVKIIYKNIHELKVGSDEEESEVVRSTDLDMVTREVSEWANQRRNEIKELREREDFRREFIGNISHELKTPIFNIQGYLLTLLDGALDDPEINRKYLKRANKSVDRMINIIDDLETISALESNTVHIQYSHFDLVELVKDVYELVADKAKKRNIRLLIKHDTDKALRVYADRNKIEQVLINLITNAIKYGKPDGMIEICFFDMDAHILTEVNDDGVGIPQEDLPRVFERFYRVDKSRSREAGGTGLGLAIVKHIIESHKQTINVRSSEDVGSTFSFTLKKTK